MPKQGKGTPITNPHAVGGYFHNYEVDVRIQPIDQEMRAKLASSNVVVFQHQNPQKVGPVACFSNFSNHPVNLPDVTGKLREFPTSEHYFQMAKLDVEKLQKKYNTPEKLEKFYEKSFQMDAKEIYKACGPKGKYKKLTYARSEEQSLADMRRAVETKFSLHEGALVTLLATGDKELIEAVHYDSKWGIGKDGRGQNLLGRQLAEIRNQAYQNLALFAVSEGKEVPDQASLYNNPVLVEGLIRDYKEKNQSLQGVSSRQQQFNPREISEIGIQEQRRQREQRGEQLPSQLQSRRNVAQSVYQLMPVDSSESSLDEGANRSGSTSFEEISQESFTERLERQRGPVEQFKRGVAGVVQISPTLVDVDITAGGDFMVMFPTAEKALKFALSFKTAANELRLDDVSIIINDKHIAELAQNRTIQCAAPALRQAINENKQQISKQ